MLILYCIAYGDHHVYSMPRRKENYSSKSNALNTFVKQSSQ